MAEPVKVYYPGKGGVNIDSDAFLQADDELLDGVNVYHDPTLGNFGGLRKRPGLRRFSEDLDLAILGGITSPVAGTGGAPAATGTGPWGTESPTGDSTGTGDGTGAPGGDLGTSSTVPAGAGAFTATTLFNGRRIIAIGRFSTNTTVPGVGWYLTSEEVADTPTLTDIPGPPGVPAADTQAPGLADGFTAGTNGQVGHKGVMGRSTTGTDGGHTWLYYGTPNNTALGDSRCTIRRTNGGTDAMLYTVPRNDLDTDSGGVNTKANFSSANSNQRQQVSYIHVGSDGYLYISAIDIFHMTGTTAGGDNNRAGRVFQARQDGTGTFLGLNTDLNSFGVSGTKEVPYPLAYFSVNGTPYCFVGTYRGLRDEASALYVLTPGTAGNYTLDRTVDAEHAGITCMQEYNGRLFAATLSNTAGAAVVPRIFTRSPTAAIADAGAWTSLDQGPRIDFAGATGNYSYWPSMVLFGSDLYASYYNNGAAKSTTIYKITANNPGDPSSTSFTFTQKYTDAAARPIYLTVDHGHIYAVHCGGNPATATSKIMWSTDGTTWSTPVVFPSTSNSGPEGCILFGMDQV